MYINKAEELTCKYNTRNPEIIAKEMGIDIIHLPYTELDGIAASVGEHKIMGVNSSLEEPLQKFVIAHELGHFVLHPQGNFFFVLRKTMLYSKFEYQANLFAVALCFGKKIAQDDDIKSVITGQVKDFYSIAKIL